MKYIQNDTISMRKIYTNQKENRDTCTLKWQGKKGKNGPCFHNGHF